MCAYTHGIILYFFLFFAGVFIMSIIVFINSIPIYLFILKIRFLKYGADFFKSNTNFKSGSDDDISNNNFN